MPFRIALLAVLAFAAAPAFPQSSNAICAPGNPRTAAVSFRIQPLGSNCWRATAGFSDEAGSFGGLSLFTGNYLGLGEVLHFDAEYGVRMRKVELGLTKPWLADKRLRLGFTAFGQRYRYDQGRDASLLAFSRDVPESDAFAPDNLLQYISHDYGGTAFVRFAPRRSFSDVGLTYTYDVTGIRPLSPASDAYFSELHFLKTSEANGLSGIRSSKASLSYLYNIINHPLRPTEGMMFSASFSIAGLGGDVNTIGPAIEAKWFHPGIWRRHVIAARLRGRMLAGYGGKAAPPFDREYMGGEQDIRGFPSFALSPIAYFPSAAFLTVLNDFGTPRTQRIIMSDGSIVTVPLLMSIPVYRPVSTGGDTKVVGNIEYRIPLFGPLTLVLFTDAGVDRTSFASQLRLNPSVVDSLNARFAADFTNRPVFQPQSQEIRMSSGAELQLLVPKIQVPVRFYWAYNLLACGDRSGIAFNDAVCNNLVPPDMLTRSSFPNNATFLSSLSVVGPRYYQEPRTMFRIAIGFSF